MRNPDELKQLAKTFSDKARKSVVVGDEVLVPHKFKEPDGEIVTAENFDPKKDLSRLNLTDWRFLQALATTDNDVQKAAELAGVTPETARRLKKKLAYFDFEDAKQKALVARLSPDFVAARHIENVYTNALEDGQRDSLKELAKITGAYKPTTNIQVNANILTMPQLTPDQAKAAREFFDTIAVEVPHVA